ncbi:MULTISPECIES: amidohydrolase family protein [Gordonia]|uniref:Amidohydrolase family protein n=2 Tax=Gordonia TaxID=2053 RepID=A0A9X3D378_9ACTN|nr:MULTISPECIES: amidohydrolase family protein [Gordonia]MCF3941410.1 amidohydrolase [Gordonia tangerina]MCX2964208.1 amidohydrolase family protein [Gordonia aquimaris]
MFRIDTHHHLIPPSYRAALAAAGIDAAGGRDLPDWSPDTSIETMDALAVHTAILSVSTPGTTFLDDAAAAVRLASELNDYCADLIQDRPQRFGFFATLPTPRAELATAEAIRALDDLRADGVVLLANSAGRYLGEPGLEPLWSELNARKAVAFIHPAELPGTAVSGVPPFAADFLLDTTRAAYLLVRNKIREQYPDIRFLLSHGGGFVPYAAHRMAIAIAGDTGRSILDALDEFRTFYFDLALTASTTSLPSLLAFAQPGHITFGSDWPFAPLTAGSYFAANLENYADLSTQQRDAIGWSNAAQLFPRFDTGTGPAATLHSVRGAARRKVMRVVSKALQP